MFYPLTEKHYYRYGEKLEVIASRVNK